MTDCLDFNPRSLAGATFPRINCYSVHPNFNPRSLAGATDRSHVYKTTFNISIHAPLRERPQPSLADQTYAEISIHAPLRERLNGFRHTAAAATISIHAPLRERRNIINGNDIVDIFQSTLPCGSDYLGFKSLYIRHLIYFNPRSLAGATASKENTSLFI